MKIFVNNKDLGFWTQTEIPVVRYGDSKEIVFCNHAGADYVEEEHDIVNIDRPDVTVIDKLYVCRKCKAYHLVDDDEWQDAPEEGVYYEQVS